MKLIHRSDDLEALDVLMIWIRAGTWCIQENAAGNQEPAAGQAASPPQKRMHLNVKDHTYMCCDHMLSEPPRMKCRLRHHLGTAPSLRVTKHELDPHLASNSNWKAVGVAEAVVMTGKVPHACLIANCSGIAIADTAER